MEWSTSISVPGDAFAEFEDAVYQFYQGECLRNLQLGDWGSIPEQNKPWQVDNDIEGNVVIRCKQKTKFMDNQTKEFMPMEPPKFYRNIGGVMRQVNMNDAPKIANGSTGVITLKIKPWVFNKKFGIRFQPINLLLNKYEKFDQVPDEFMQAPPSFAPIAEGEVDGSIVDNEPAVADENSGFMPSVLEPNF